MSIESWIEILRISLRSRNKTFLTGFIIMMFVISLAIIGVYLTPYDPTKSYVVIDGKRFDIQPLLPPGSKMIVETSSGNITLIFYLGTDQLGRDVLSRVVAGARFVLLVAFIATAISSLIGIILGLISGYAGGLTDRIISLVMDAMYAFPGLILAIAVAALIGVGIINMALAIAVVYIPSYFRMMRGVVLSIKSLSYIDAVRLMGAGSFRILFKHLLPNALYSVIAVLPINFADAIITEAGLSFLGLGIPPPTPDWGFDLNRGQKFFVSGYWWIGAFPGLMIIITVLGFLLLGEGLNDILNPRRSVR